MTVRGPMLVWPLRTTCAMSLQPSPSTTCGPTTQYGPISTSFPIFAAESTRAVGSIIWRLAYQRSVPVRRHPGSCLWENVDGDLRVLDELAPHVQILADHVVEALRRRRRHFEAVALEALIHLGGSEPF